MNETVMEQKNLIDAIYSKFIIIRDSMNCVSENSKEVSLGILIVSKKNETFNDSISSLSAVGKEMEASAPHTLSYADANQDTAEHILKAVNSLKTVLVSME